jgi:predicted glycoside hydrolase/deacetylase ChbG (UPF0249 family)
MSGGNPCLIKTTRPAFETAASHSTGALIVNADDWGRNIEVTNRTLECISIGAVSAVSAMVFMADSERASGIARERGIDAGLHLNLTTPFSGENVPPALMEHQQRITRYLTRHRLAQVVFHPGLVRSFEYVVAAQRDEFRRLYGAEPGRIDGHHHMHLCSNVVFGKLLPNGIRVRRSFSFRPGEKSFWNRHYRGLADRVLERRHKMTDLFFSLPPLVPSDRLDQIFSLASRFTVEVETHPVQPEEHQFLTTGQIFRLAQNIPVPFPHTLR